MDMPKPGPEHRKLERFAGTWSGEEKMHPSPWEPEGGLASVSIVNHVACSGFHVVGDYEQRRDGVVAFQGHAVWGFDPKAQEVVLNWFDCMGMGGDVFRGKFQGERLTLECKNPMGHHRLTYDFGEKGTLRSRMESTQDGKKWNAMFDGVYHRS